MNSNLALNFQMHFLENSLNKYFILFTCLFWVLYWGYYAILCVGGSFEHGGWHIFLSLKFSPPNYLPIFSCYHIIILTKLLPTSISHIPHYSYSLLHTPTHIFHMLHYFHLFLLTKNLHFPYTLFFPFNHILFYPWPSTNFLLFPYICLTSMPIKPLSNERAVWSYINNPSPYYVQVATPSWACNVFLLMKFNLFTLFNLLIVLLSSLVLSLWQVWFLYTISTLVFLGIGGNVILNTLWK